MTFEQTFREVRKSIEYLELYHSVRWSLQVQGVKDSFTIVDSKKGHSITIIDDIEGIRYFLAGVIRGLELKK